MTVKFSTTLKVSAKLGEVWTFVFDYILFV